MVEHLSEDKQVLISEKIKLSDELSGSKMLLPLVSETEVATSSTKY